jgi:hypothetical protein
MNMVAADGDHMIELIRKVNQQYKYELGHKLNTTDSEIELCKG